MKERFYLNCMYDVNRGRFIATLLSKGYSDYQIFRLGHLNDLIMKIEFFTDKRAKLGFTPIIYVYPPRSRWVSVLEEEYIRESEFDREYIINYGSFEESERFNRLFTRWEYTLTHWNRYVMLHKAI